MIEIVSNCHTTFGRMNRLGTHLDMLEDFRDRRVEAGPELDAGKARAEGKLVVGMLHREERHAGLPGHADGDSPYGCLTKASKPKGQGEE